MALKFGPQWIRDLTDGGPGQSPQPAVHSPTTGFKFKLADYRYGREEMLALHNNNSPPPDQVRKHLFIFSKEIQRPMAMSPLTEDEQHLISQGFNSSVVLRAAGRGPAPPHRLGRGGALADRGRGRGRGRGEGYISRPLENGDLPFGRSAQDGWEQVGRKFERSFSRGYDESSSSKREYSRSSSDNWRDKRNDDEEEEDSFSWRNNRDVSRWGPSMRNNWRDVQRDLSGFDDRRHPLKSRGFDSELRGPQRTSESYDHDEVPEWVQDDDSDDPGTFDSSGVFVSTKRKKEEEENSARSRSPDRKPEETVNGTAVDNKSVNKSENVSTSVPTATDGDPDSTEIRAIPAGVAFPNKGDGDTGFAYPDKQNSNTAGAPPGHYPNPAAPVSTGPPESSAPPLLAHDHDPRTTNKFADSDFLHMEKSLQNLVAGMKLDAENKPLKEIDVSKQALPLSHENANKWFYKDPQGEVQGPFTNEDMSVWLRAGYFTLSLVVKRGCDDSFKQLGELIKRYGRVPFLPGPPLPPLITSTSSPMEPILPQPMIATPSPIPSFVSPVMPGLTPGIPAPALGSMHDGGLFLRQVLLQQEYVKQSFMISQMQIVSKLQEDESFKALSLEEQQHLVMQMMMQTNPILTQQFQQLQHQHLLLQQQQQHEQPVPIGESSIMDNRDAFSHPMMQPPSNNIVPSTASDTATTTANTNHKADKEEESSIWENMHQQLNSAGGVWSKQPVSLWGMDPINAMAQAKTQLEKMKRSEGEEERAREEERIRVQELETKQKELQKQQDEISRQKEQMKREKEEMERRKLIEIQNLEETRKAEEESIQHDMEKKRKEEERRRQEEERKMQEEEKKRQKELKKQEEKRKKEEEKLRAQEEQRKKQEQRKQQEELRRQKEEVEELRLQKEKELEEQRMHELQQQEEEERERRENERKQQQLELQKQQESLRRLQQQQQQNLANMQLPAASNWASQRTAQGMHGHSKSLMEIQEEETLKEIERQQEHEAQMMRMHEHAVLQTQQIQQKTWASHTAQGVARGPSLLDIQQQEQENAKMKMKEDMAKAQINQSKSPLASAPTWSGANSASIWGSQPIWDASAPSSVNSGAMWETAGTTNQKKTQHQQPVIKESGEFPALKNQSQQGKKNSAKASKKAGSSKLKKEEETVQKLFQNRQQDGFASWVTERVKKFSAQIDVPTFVSFIIEVDSPDDVRDYVKMYLGESKEAKDFAKQFVENRSKFRNQARLEKQQEEDSIWGPAPAINPHSQSQGAGGSNSGGNSASQSKGKNKKKKQKMQKLDGSVLGFTVHADPNRKNAAGEVESFN